MIDFLAMDPSRALACTTLSTILQVHVFTCAAVNLTALSSRLNQVVSHWKHIGQKAMGRCKMTRREFVDRTGGLAVEMRMSSFITILSRAIVVVAVPS